MYEMEFNATTFSIRKDGQDHRFSGRACGSEPKLYLFGWEHRALYIGVTKQAIRTRLRLGWKADGSGGYRGYALRNHRTSAELYIWYLENVPSGKDPKLEIETIEAEVAYLVRSRGQWPIFQTEIHFHQSNKIHRKLAEQILSALPETP